MGKTCKPMDVSFQYMTKSTTNKKKIKKKKVKKKNRFNPFPNLWKFLFLSAFTLTQKSLISHITSSTQIFPHLKTFRMMKTSKVSSLQFLFVQEHKLPLTWGNTCLWYFLEGIQTVANLQYQFFHFPFVNRIPKFQLGKQPPNIYTTFSRLLFSSV